MLEDKYLVLKRSDIEKYIDNSNTRKLEIMVDKLNKARHKDGKKVNKKYTVVSETMNCYPIASDLVISEINGTGSLKDNQEVQKIVYKAVEAALIAEREKIKKVLPTERLVINPDPEDETIEDEAEELEKRIKELEKKTTIKKKRVTNVKNKS